MYLLFLKNRFILNERKRFASLPHTRLLSRAG